MQGLKTNAHNQYLKARVESSSPLGLVVLLYEGAIKYVKLSREDFMNNDTESACDHLIRAQNIIRELQKSLDMSVEELSPRLFWIYDYMVRQLIQANIKRNVEPINQVLKMLGELKEAWETIAGKVELKPVERAVPSRGELSLSG